MSEMHFKKPIFTYGACGTFTKNNSRYIYQNKLGKASFQ